MKKKLFKTALLHFGSDKTGSSSIQRALNTHRELLNSYGIYYPSGAWHNELASCVSVDPVNEAANIVFGFNDRDFIIKRDQIYLNNIINEIQKKNGEYIVFSNENFIFLERESVVNLYNFAIQFAEFCKIVIYIRSPESYAISGMSQRIKMGFDPWNPLPISNVYHLLRSLEGTFPDDTIKVRLFDKSSLVNGNVVNDFFSTLGLDDSLIKEICKGAITENPSLSFEAQVIGEYIIKKAGRKKITSLAFMESYQKILESIEGQKRSLTKTQANDIKSASIENSIYIKNRFNIVFPVMEYECNLKSPSISNETAESIANIIIDYASLKFQSETSALSANDYIIKNGSGFIECNSAPSILKSLDCIFLEVEIHNNTDTLWRTDTTHPINISYHWLNEDGTCYEFEGSRSILPDGGIPARCKLQTVIKIIAPREPGKYQLVLTLVQERVVWFEKIGFNPCLIAVDVVPEKYYKTTVTRSDS